MSPQNVSAPAGDCLRVYFGFGGAGQVCEVFIQAPIEADVSDAPVRSLQLFGKPIPVVRSLVSWLATHAESRLGMSPTVKVGDLSVAFRYAGHKDLVSIWNAMARGAIAIRFETLHQLIRYLIDIENWSYSCCVTGLDAHNRFIETIETPRPFSDFLEALTTPNGQCAYSRAASAVLAEQSYRPCQMPPPPYSAGAKLRDSQQHAQDLINPSLWRMEADGISTVRRVRPPAELEEIFKPRPLPFPLPEIDERIPLAAEGDAAGGEIRGHIRPIEVDMDALLARIEPVFQINGAEYLGDVEIDGEDVTITFNPVNSSISDDQLPQFVLKQLVAFDRLLSYHVKLEKHPELRSQLVELGKIAPSIEPALRKVRQLLNEHKFCTGSEWRKIKADHKLQPLIDAANSETPS